MAEEPCYFCIWACYLSRKPPHTPPEEEQTAFSWVHRETGSPLFRCSHYSEGIHAFFSCTELAWSLISIQKDSLPSSAILNSEQGHFPSPEGRTR